MTYDKEIVGTTVRGSLYSGMAAAVTFVLGFIRMVLMARLLMPECFGVVALALFFVHSISILFNFDIRSAFIHCQRDGEALKKAYFSIQTCLCVIQTVVLLIAAPILQKLYPDVAHFYEVLTAFTLMSFVMGLNLIQTAHLQKELAFTSLATVEIISSLVMTVVGPMTAWMGWGVWALVAERGGNTLATLILTWGPFRRWRPKLGWDLQSVKLFWCFGMPAWIKMNLTFLIEKFDDFWIGSTLGQTPLGYYDRAYDFACAPRRIFALPLLKVLEPVFARLQHDRRMLSKTFMHSAYLLVRLVFFAAGLFAFLMPEFIRLVIGDKWLPMLWTFRLLLVYAVFDSILKLIQGLFLAVGKPKVLRNAAIVQAAYFIPAVIFGAYWAGVNGVAVATNGMLVLGICCLYRPLTQTVKFSVWHILGWPVLVLSAAFGLGVLLESMVKVTIVTLAIMKIVYFVLLFGGVLLFIEGKEYFRNVNEVWGIMKRS